MNVAIRGRVEAGAMLATLKRVGISHVIWLPDTESGEMFEELASDSSIRLVQIAREGEAIPIAAGLLATGHLPVVMIQNTGLYESGDSLRGLGVDCHLPLLLIVGYRGYEEDKASRGEDQADSAATYLEPYLRAWRIPYQLMQSNDDLQAIDAMIAEARSRRGPAAVLLCGEYM